MLEVASEKPMKNLNLDKLFAFDIEIYPNFFLLLIKSMNTGRLSVFASPLNPDALAISREAARKLTEFLKSDATFVSFNGEHFDLPILTLALRGASVGQCKDAANQIIEGNLKQWQFYERHRALRPDISHVDLIEVSPGIGSLKLYGARLHAPKLQDLPLAPDAIITEQQVELLTRYCENDVDTTALLFRQLEKKIVLRDLMGARYGVDMLSKSEAQIAESVIKIMMERETGVRPCRPLIPPGRVYRYVPPQFVQFKTPELRKILNDIWQADFVIAENGNPIEPACLRDRTVTIGGSTYRLGLGGLHSSEEVKSHKADEQTCILDVDVTSYYPSIILRCKLSPEHLGDKFLNVYREIFNNRIAAKRFGDKATNEVLKIVLNGSFGKLGSKWSALYAPDLMLQVTLTGQLCLLMLIESMEAAGISVVSANTDGIVLKFPHARLPAVHDLVERWENQTGFEMEETEYASIFSRDVNNYIAVKVTGEIKGKGAYAEDGLTKNPQNPICVEAVKEFLTTGKSIAQTIFECRDIRKFLTVRTVKGGAVFAGQPIGRAVRWYLRRNSQECIYYAQATAAGTKPKVANSDGAAPLPDLPDDFPTDIDYGRYVEGAYQILNEIGAYA